MNPREKILRTELVSAGTALLCCLLLCIACFLLAGLPSASLILLAAALPLSLVILPCALTWYSGRFCWAAPIFLTLGFILIPSYFLRGYFLEIGLAGLASGLFAAAVQGFHLAARREMPCTAWAAYGGLTVLYLFVSLLDLLHDGRHLLDQLVKRRDGEFFDLVFMFFVKFLAVLQAVKLKQVDACCGKACECHNICLFHLCLDPQEAKKRASCLIIF